MQCFIGIVPPASIANAITAIQKPYGDNRTEPHITLRSPVHVANKEDWIKAVETIAKAFKPLPISLVRTGYFGTRVLFIEANSIELNELQAQLISAIKPHEVPGKPEHSPYHAHLTLGRQNVGFRPQALFEMQQLANLLLVQPLNFTVTFLRVYFKPSVHERYKVLTDINLGISPDKLTDMIRS